MRLFTPLCALILLARPAFPAPSIDDAFHRLYNFDFAASRSIADQYAAANPGDPMGPATRAAAWLFSELHRLNLLGKEFMTSDDRIKGGERALPKEQARREFLRSVAEAKALAGGKDDVRSLLAMTIVYGLERDYDALVEKRLRASLESARESQRYARRLIARDPSQKDAYFTFGFSEYLVGSLPFFARWFMKMDGVEGDKARGLEQLEIAANEGRYLKPFAQMMLAMFYVREKRPVDSKRHLRELAREYPGNPAVKAELTRIGGGE